MALYLGNGLDNTLSGKDESDQIYGYGGNDILSGGGGDDQIVGGSGNDVLNGGEGADFLNGGTGNDTADYSENTEDISVNLDHRFGDGRGFHGTAEGDRLVGIENLIGGSGRDAFWGDDFGNILTGGSGDDYLRGRGGNDQHIGGDGADFMEGGLGNDHFDGGPGNDRVSYYESEGAVAVDLTLFSASGGDAEGDTLQGVEELSGSSFNDKLNGDAKENSILGSKGNDTLLGRGADDGLWGGAGNDVLEGGLDDDYLDGGDGKDTASYRHAESGVALALEGIHVRIGEAIGDKLFSIEQLMGSEFADVLGGSSGINRLTGRGGDDFLYSGDGDDELFGNQGADVLLGGKGADVHAGSSGADKFYFTGVDEGGDTIADFGKGADTLDFKSTSFGGLPLGALDASLFVANDTGKAQTAEQRFTYELDTGIVRYDSNGGNAGGVTIIATLTGAPAIDASRIVIVDEILPF